MDNGSQASSSATYIWDIVHCWQASHLNIRSPNSWSQLASSMFEDRVQDFGPSIASFSVLPRNIFILYRLKRKKIFSQSHWHPSKYIGWSIAGSGHDISLMLHCKIVLYSTLNNVKIVKYFNYAIRSLFYLSIIFLSWQDLWSNVCGCSNCWFGLWMQ